MKQMRNMIILTSKSSAGHRHKQIKQANPTDKQQTDKLKPEVEKLYNSYQRHTAIFSDI